MHPEGPLRAYLMLHYMIMTTQSSYVVLVNRNKGFASNISAANVNNSFVVNKEILCVSKCLSTAACNLVQFQENTGLCVIYSGCMSIQLQATAGTTTYVSETLISTSSSSINVLPPAMFDWMMTDSCGFLNQGYYLPGLKLIPVNYNTSTPWNYSFVPAPSDGFENAILYPGTANYLSITDRANITLDLTSKSLTLFCYFFLNEVSSFPLIEFGYTGYTQAPHFWYYIGGLYYNFVNSLCSGTCSQLGYTFTPPLRAWTHAALVYDVNSKQVSMFLNGTRVSVSAYTNFTGVYNNMFVPDENNEENTDLCLRFEANY